MKASVFHGPQKISVDTVDDPKIEAATDIILKVTSTAICGSDLHIYNGFLPQKKPMTLGHEFMGIVEEVGTGITNLKRGDRVFVPFPIACGACFFCDHSLPGHCESSNPEKYGPEGGVLDEKGGALFGYTDLYGGYDGGQAEYVRVPYAHFGPRKVPDSLSDDQVLFLTDIIPTGFSGIDWAQPKGGETVVVFGCGPIGIMAMKAAWIRGASRVFGVDRERYRMAKAVAIAGVEALHAEDDDVSEIIRAATNGRGADIAVDAVGLEAHRSFGDKLANVVHGEMGSISALKAAISAVRRGGTLSILGVYGMPYDNFPIGQLFDKGITLKMGQAPVHAIVDELLGLVVEGKLRADDVITHKLPLSEAARGYEMFSKKQDDCVKVVLTP